MLLRELATGRRQAARLYDPTTAIEALVRAKAPSFQATAMGPALFLASRSVPVLPRISHDDWMTALGSGDVDDLLRLLDEANLNPDKEGSETCLSLAKSRNWDISPVPLSSSLYVNSAHEPVRAESLPYAMFPPGMSYFGQDQEEGIRPCVVHANYATGKEKERLLRERGLWALVGGDDGEDWTCDAGVMQRA